MMFVLGALFGAFVGAMVIGLCASRKEDEKEPCCWDCMEERFRIASNEILEYFKIKLLEHRTDEHGILWKDIDDTIEEILKEVNSENDNT